MRCPFCKISSMHPVESGGKEIDRCETCGAIWFDPGEIRELTEGRLTFVEQGKAGPSPPAPWAPMAGMHALAASLRCPRCESVLSAIDYQATGVPVIVCSACRGFLVPRESATKLSERFAFTRLNAARYAAMGESMAAEMKKSLDLKYLGNGNSGTGANPSLALPVVVPLSSGAAGIRSFPAATWTFLAIPLIMLILSALGGASCRLPWGAGGLPSGTGVTGGSISALLAYPFLPGGFLPLGAGMMFLFVLGRPVEERTGSVPFAGLYILGAVTAGVAHMMAGRIGAPVALGSAGAVAAVLGAYLVYFPDVSITMYGMGRIVSAPAYMFACFWALGTLMANPEIGGMTGLLLRIGDPTPLSIWGSLAGFASGVLFGAVHRSREDRFL